MRPFAVIAGGGTAGHLTPALAVGRALVERGHPVSSVHYVGSHRGLESRLVPDAGFPITLLPGRGIERRLAWANVAAVAGLAVALVRSVWLLARHRPAVVLSVGGYASAPCAVAAVVLRVPLVLAEQNAVPGAALRLVARFARASAVSFDGTPLPHAVVTGNPVRAEVLAVERARDREQARDALGLPPDRAVLLCFGGSLGALRINVAVVDAIRGWAARTDLAVRHVVGARDWDLVTADQPALPSGGLVWQPVRYEERMHLAMAAADLAVCRAGASTVAELAVVGLPSVLVPLPHAPGDHQTANARALERAGAAVVVADHELDGARLAATVDALLGDRTRLERMAKAALAVARRDAAERVADLLEEHASSRRATR